MIKTWGVLIGGENPPFKETPIKSLKGLTARPLKVSEISQAIALHGCLVATLHMENPSVSYSFGKSMKIHVDVSRRR